MGGLLDVAVEMFVISWSYVAGLVERKGIEDFFLVYKV